MLTQKHSGYDKVARLKQLFHLMPVGWRKTFEIAIREIISKDPPDFPERASFPQRALTTLLFASLNTSDKW